MAYILEHKSITCSVAARNAGYNIEIVVLKIGDSGHNDSFIPGRTVFIVIDDPEQDPAAYKSEEGMLADNWGQERADD